MLFVYRDGAGAETLRKLTSFREDASYLRGYCEYSGGMRTFRKDRIITHLDDDNADAFSHVSPPSAGRSRDEMDDDYRWEVCFTGFKAPIRAALEAMAISGGMAVRKSVTANLDFLCVGDNAGSTKMLAAEHKGCHIITPDQLYDLINDGVLPDGFGAKKKSVKWTEISAKDAQRRFSG
jgi:predicted DNA-binding transcriptional regulator YafY